MRAGLFWLNDGQWACIARRLPANITEPERANDRGSESVRLVFWSVVTG
jgi:hypothetical protein